MPAKITRKRALELAQKAISLMMEDELILLHNAKNPETRKSIDARYAELAAALAWLEAASRQKEMHL